MRSLATEFNIGPESRSSLFPIGTIVQIKISLK